MLDAKKVRTIMLDCLYTDADEEITDAGADAGEIPANAVVVEGITRKVGMHKERLESHRQEVSEMLAELPDEFQESKGGGWSFLNACVDKNGNQWGEHINIEELLLLAVGLGIAKFQMPRELWPVLPGGMPYFSVNV